MNKYYIEKDLTITNDVTNLEALAFITNNFHKHNTTEGSLCVIDKGTTTEYNLNTKCETENKSIREKALRDFNQLLDREIGKLTPTRISVFKIYVEENQKENAYTQIRRLGKRYCEEEKRVMAIIPHFEQKYVKPYMYVIYNKPFNKSNEFQKYIKNNIHDAYIEE